MYKANIHVTLRKSILDPKGKAAHNALKNLGLGNIQAVRIGKLIEMDIDAENEQKANEIATSAAEQLLANEVMEDFIVKVEKSQ